jgi:hypothetical protein
MEEYRHGLACHSVETRLGGDTHLIGVDTQLSGKGFPESDTERQRAASLRPPSRLKLEDVSPDLVAESEPILASEWLVRALALLGLPDQRAVRLARVESVGPAAIEADLVAQAVRTGVAVEDRAISVGPPPATRRIEQR